MPGAKRVIFGMPAVVFLVATLWSNFGRLFWVRGACRPRPGTIRVCSTDRAVASASAASSGSDVVAVTLLWIMDRTAVCQLALNDTASVLSGAGSRRGARPAAAGPFSDPAELARISCVPVIQAQNSLITPRGVPARSTGPAVRSPAPRMVVLSSPKVVSEADQRVWQVPRSASAGAAT